MRLNLALAGFGNVGRRFVRLLKEREAELAALGLETSIVGITTKRHGALFSARGIDAVEQAARVEGGGRLDDGIGVDAKDVFGMIARTADLWQPAALIETTVLDITAGQPALDHTRAALRAGLHVVTANKGPVAFAARDLLREASERAVCFLFEGAVMDGVPIFNLVRETLPSARITGFEGVLNTTTNQILAALERGESMEAALARMQREGIAEADPSLDVDGWDAAAKTAALANVLLDANITPQQVQREGLTSSVEARVRDAASRGMRVKLIAHASKSHGSLQSRVSLEEVPAASTFGILEGPSNAIRLDTDVVGPIVMTQLEGSLTATAYALVSDLVRVARRLQGRG